MPGSAAAAGRPALDPSAPAWPLWLLRFECAAIYGASGLSKLVDPDWFGGTVTWQRVVRAREDLEAWPLPDWAISLLTDRSFHVGAAKLIVLTELFIALGLWWRPTRYAAVWVAVVFHLTIETSASVQVFSLLGIAVLVVWAVPSTRDRALRIDPAIRRAPATGRGGGRARLARALPDRARPAGFPPRARRSRRHRAHAEPRRSCSSSAACRRRPGSRSRHCSSPRCAAPGVPAAR